MARTKQTLHYTLGCEGDEYEVELFDLVEFEWFLTGPLTHCGVVTAMYPRKRELRIQYEDEGDWTKATAVPKKKVATVPIAAVSFMRRDM